MNKIILAVMLWASPAAVAVTMNCGLEQAVAILRASAFQNVSEDGVPSSAEICGDISVIEHAVDRLMPNTSGVGGDYQVLLCETVHMGRNTVVITDVYCTGEVEHSLFTVN